MRFFIILLLLCCWPFQVMAQLPDDVSIVSEQWELTLDVIKSKTQALIVKNNGLMIEYQQMLDEIQMLEQAVAQQQEKNTQMEHFLKIRNGLTDQQVRIAELIPLIKSKKQGLRELNEEFRDLSKKEAGIAHRTQALKYTLTQVQSHQQTATDTPASGSSTDSQLLQLQEQLQDEDKREAMLQDQLADLKSGGKAHDLNTLNLENRQLQEQLDSLQARSEHFDSYSQVASTNANKRKYEQLKKREEKLLANINNYEGRMDELRHSSLVTLSWPAERKKLVHQLVLTDARNNRIKEKIKVVREDIDVLRDQVGSLERRVDFIQNKPGVPSY